MATMLNTGESSVESAESLGTALDAIALADAEHSALTTETFGGAAG